MALFKPTTNEQAFLKAGLMGFAGSGKTYTASELAIGLVGLMRERTMPLGDRPVFFLDTEVGSDWVAPRFAAKQIALETAKTRAFSDLLTAVTEAEKKASILIVDSITHVWRDLCDSFMKKKNVTRLEFQHWATLKKEWGRFTDLFINSQAHIIICGRAGYEYDYFEDSDGKKQLEKTGIKMKAETEMGYEPSLLILMERETDPDSKAVTRTAYVLKDRSTRLDGKQFTNPTFESFRPHIDCLNLGGHQLGVDTARTSEGMFNAEGDTSWKVEQQQKAVALEEIQNELVKYFPSTSGQDRKMKIVLLEEVFNTSAWAKIETLKAAELVDGLAVLRDILTDAFKLDAMTVKAEHLKLREPVK